MIALPVLAVSAADVVYKTSDVNSVESLDQRHRRRRRPGRTSTRTPRGSSSGVDPNATATAARAGSSRHRRPPSTTSARRSAATSRHHRRRRLAPTSTPSAAWSDRRAPSSTPSSPLADGLFRLTSGRWPSDAVEVDGQRGPGRQGVRGRRDPHRSTTATSLHRRPGSPSRRRAKASPDAARPARLTRHRRPDGRPSAPWLIGGGPVSWDEVRALNAVGADGAVPRGRRHPPPDSEIPAELQQLDSGPTTPTSPRSCSWW